MMDYLTANFTYDRDAGQVFSNRRGKPALSLHGNGYYGVHTTENNKTKTFKAHHVVWFFEYGEWPTSCIDHIDGVKTNNHYTNLRLVTHRENAQAYRMSQKATSPYLGVSWNKQTKRFRACIRRGKAMIHLGSFSCELEAARAYDKALMEMGLKPVNINIMEKNVERSSGSSTMFNYIDTKGSHN